ncbi:MAG: glycerol kinase GlpK [Coprobacillus sp.]|nr:glycerol kinase GlpK [Coprobacillus sp.]
MGKYILSIDQGTTSSRAILFDHNGHIFKSAYREIKNYFPKPGWVEIDPQEIWISVVEVVNEVLIKANISYSSIDSIGITNQRETVVVWEEESGLPIYNAINWQSRQSSEICERYTAMKEYIHKKTGLLINPYFSASKIRYILENVKGAEKKAKEGKLLCGTIDTWLMYKMSEGKIFATDVSNASRTMLFNINTCEWDKDLLDLFKIPSHMLPKVCPSSYDYGIASFFDKNLHICGVAGDQQASLFGHTCFKKGDSKNTYGTGCFMLTNTGKTPVYSKNGLLTTIAWQVGSEITYALEGSVFIGGAVVQWLKDEMKMIRTSDESEKEAYLCDTTGGVYLVPAFVGLGTPYWNDDVRGAVFGLTRGTNKHQFIRAALDSIAYQCADVYEVMKKETKLDIPVLSVDGGATENNYLLQFEADILRIYIERTSCKEITALGACYLAGLYTGYFPTIESIKKTHEVERAFTSEITREEANKYIAGWKKAVKATEAYKVSE